MKRLIVNPREGWKEIVESQGLTFHSLDAKYWNEGKYYSFTDNEIAALERAGTAVHQMALQAAEKIIKEGSYERMDIDETSAALIEKSWNADEWCMYGRFDFAFSGEGAYSPKLLEYNADTPTSLLEASVVQWHWLKDTFGEDADQFNSMEEKLIARWRELKRDNRLNERVYFSTLSGVEEDMITTSYIQDTATRAGLETKFIDLAQIGWDSGRKAFVDGDNAEMKNVFKLYPWEWMMREDFGKNVAQGNTRFIEPAWKMLWSNKAILPVLWEMFPRHPNLVPAYFEEGKIKGDYVRKPMLSREGANVDVVIDGQKQSTKGTYGDGKVIYQEFVPIQKFSGSIPVLGLWMIGDYCSGMGIRESDGLVTGNTSRFTPHCIQ